MTRKYLDPKNDLAFKKIFCQEKKKEIPISFLNAVFNLQGEDTIVDLDFLDVVQPPEIASRKESIVDVLVRDQKGTRYIIEMQVVKIEGFEKRAQYYAAKTYCSHFNVGGTYEGLKRVVFLAITSYEVFPEKKGIYKSDHVVLDKVSYEHDLKDFSFTFVELPKFNKTEEELETLEDKWYYFLKHADESQTIAESLNANLEIKEAFHILERTLWTESELSLYEKVAMAVADAKGALLAAKKEGRAEGKIEGKAEGIEIGKAEAQMQMITRMMKKGMSIETISEISQMSPDEIQDLLSNKPPS